MTQVLLQDVAKKAKVSSATASVVLNNKSSVIRISEATRKRVKEQAIKMGYRPNLLAKGLRKGKTHTIGFLTGSPALEIVSTM
ncbi:MAG: LacI family DNA-binding transcriptional regulator, partial [Phycisphaerae bacterium]|nr:LacI family DNA-binding transcriptional regulator [Phycisphaerae bacterium]